MDGSYSKNKMHGAVKEYYESGELKFDGIYENG